MSDVHLWQHLHGASAHFPISLTFAAFFLDLCGLFAGRTDRRERQYDAGRYCMLLSSAGALVAVLSGLIVNRWELSDSGLLGQHHAFIVPAVGLLVGLTTWRWFVGRGGSRAFHFLYLLVLLPTVVVLGVAAFYGAEYLRTR
jgi:uncharacterized membrane protein